MKLPYLQSPHGNDPVIVEGEFRTSAQRLFRAWTTPEEIKLWFGPGQTGPAIAEVDLRKGGMWEFMFIEPDGQTDTLSGEYVKIAPGEQLIFTWKHERRLPDGETEITQPSLVTLDFEEVEGGTRLRLTHERIVKEAGRLGVGIGWGASFEKLKRMVEGQVRVGGEE